MVDTQGLIVAVKVHAANIDDRDGAPLLLADMPERFPRIRTLWADSGYIGHVRARAADQLVDGVADILNYW